MKRIIDAIMQTKDNRTHSSEIRRYEHLLRTYEDADFIAEVASMRRELENKYGNGVSLQVALPAVMVYAQTGMPYVKEEQDREAVRKLASDWLMDLEDLVYFADNPSLQKKKPLRNDTVRIGAGKNSIHVASVPRPPVRKNKNIKVGMQGKKVVIEIGPLATREELLAGWSSIEYLQRIVYGGKRKQKEAENYDLVHAIFKARREGKTFLQIFMAYTMDALEGYEQERGHSYKRFGTHNSLEKYYRRHCPTLTDR